MFYKKTQEMIPDEFVDTFIKQNYKKKIVIIYGNCHTTAIISLLSNYKPFTSIYSIFPIMAIQDIYDPSYFNSKIFNRCELFIHQDIRKNNRYGIQYASDSIILRLNSECQIIAIPNLYHLPMCFFPQYIDKKDLLGRDGKTSFFRDSILDDMFMKKRGILEALTRYEDKNIFTQSINQDFNDFIKKVCTREVNWTIKVSDYINDNYKNEQLFFDPNHPTPVLIRKITKEILLILNIAFIQYKFDEIKDLRLDSFEMPICKSVTTNLNMNINSNELRLNGIKVKRGKMYLKDYIAQYFSLIWQIPEMPFEVKAKSLLLFFLYKCSNIIKKKCGI